MSQVKGLAEPLTKESTLLSFDLESNGLHGEAFAVGAVLMNADGVVLDEFVARTEIVGDVDEWVEHNVLPVMTDMVVTHFTAREMRDDFWAWFVAAQQKASYTLVLNGYPVEHRFLLQCQDDDLPARYWQHPFPLLDLTSMLLQAGYDSERKRSVMSKVTVDHGFAKHHPVHDAKVAAMTAFYVAGGGK